MKGIDEAIVLAVLEDWQTAPISEPLRATLGFLAKLNNTPDEVTTDDIVALEEQGISKQAIEEAAYVCFVFNLIDRLADAFDFQIGNEKELKKIGNVLYNLGYGIASIPG